MTDQDYQLIIGACVLFPLGVYIAFRIVDTIVAKLFL
jgi:hypothetical protein